MASSEQHVVVIVLLWGPSPEESEPVVVLSYFNFIFIIQESIKSNKVTI